MAQEEDPLSAYVDRTEVSLNDVFTLTLRVNAELSNSPPDISALDQDFEQLGVSQTSSFTLINNVSESWNEYRISLRPRSSGELTIPAFRLGSEVTQPISITVNEAPQNSANRDDFFISSTLNKDTVYVQEQLLYTVRIYFSTPFDRGANLSQPQVEGAVIQRLGDDRSYQEVLNGLRYNVIERRYALFPQSSGTLRIDPINFSATVGQRRSGSIFSNRMTGGRQIVLSSDAHDVTVMSKPASFPLDATWLPSSELTLQESWSRDLQGIEVGEAITRNLTIRADGISSSLLPDVEFNETDTLKFYPDQANREDLANQNGVTGVRSQGTAIVASTEGDFILPAIEIPWWNTETDTMEIARLPEYSLNVINTGSAVNTTNSRVDNTTASVNTSVETGLQSVGNSSNLWIYATTVFALAWLFSSGMWYRTRMALQQFYQGYRPVKHNSAQPSAPVKTVAEKPSGNKLNTTFQVLQFACKEKNLSNIRQALLSWGRSYFGDERILSLEQLKSRIEDKELQIRLDELENCIYGTTAGQQEFDAEALLNQVKTMHKNGPAHNHKKATGDFSLPPLYKN